MADTYLHAALTFYSRHLQQADEAIEDLSKEHATMKMKAGLDAEWIDVTKASIEHYERSKALFEKQIAAIKKKIAEEA